MVTSNSQRIVNYWSSYRPAPAPTGEWNQDTLELFPSLIPGDMNEFEEEELPELESGFGQIDLINPAHLYEPMRVQTIVVPTFLHDRASNADIFERQYDDQYPGRTFRQLFQRMDLISLPTVTEANSLDSEEEDIAAIPSKSMSEGPTIQNQDISETED